jgi:hypothetical protein
VLINCNSDKAVSRNNDNVADASGLSTASRTAVVQYGHWDGSNQQWQLVRIG